MQIVTFKNLANIEGLAMCYNNLGVSYMEYEIFDSAIFYFDNCLVEYKKLGDESKFAATHNNIDLIYKDL